MGATITMASEECSVCAEPYTGKVRAKIHCTGCDYVACKECCKTYILGQSKDPHCMSCKQKWTRDFMFDNFGRGFVNTTYKKHKKELLFEIEKSKIPATMPRVEAYKEITHTGPDSTQQYKENASNFLYDLNSKYNNIIKSESYGES